MQQPQNNIQDIPWEPVPEAPPQWQAPQPAWQPPPPPQVTYQQPPPPAPVHMQPTNFLSNESQVPAIIRENGIISHQSSQEQMMTLAETMVREKIVPFKTAGECFSVMIMGAALGLHPGVAVNHINNIKGRAAVDSHIIGYLIQRAGIEMEVTKNYQFIYGSQGEVLDIEHEIVFYKKSELIKGKILTYTQRLTWNQCMEAGWTTRDAWKNYPFLMLPYRCRTIGAKQFDPGCLLGFMDTSEALETEGVNYDLNQEGHIIIK